MKYGKIGAGCLAVVLCLGTMPVTAWAGTPEFAYTAEQWASLRDNQLEFTEIADLIHVYNNTVIQNQLEYEDFRGEDADDIADDYYDAADDIYGSLEYPDSSDSDYASRLSSYLSSQIQADNLREQGDDNVEDGDVKKLEYDKTEAGLVKEAQELMISYWSQTYSLESLEQNKIQAQSSYDQTLNRLSAGMSTQAQLKEAQKNLDTAKNSLESLRLQASQLRQQLLTMLGIEDSSQVVIGTVPEPDMAAIEAVDYESDKIRAMGNDKSVQNARHTSASSTTEINIRFSLVDEAEGTKEAAFLASYQNLQASKTAYEAALTAFQSAQLAYEGLQRKQQAGLLTSTEYLEGQAAYLEKKAAKETASMNLAAAYESYCWDVKGISQT